MLDDCLWYDCGGDIIEIALTGTGKWTLKCEEGHEFHVTGLDEKGDVMQKEE